ncbi:MAG: hypothetical protein ACRDIF_06915, partial [Actinomycetota bacterium]
MRTRSLMRTRPFAPRAVLSCLLACLLALAGPWGSSSSASAEPSPPDQVPTRPTNNDPAPAGDIGIPERLVGRAFNAWLSGVLSSAIRPVMESVGGAVFSTPDLAHHPRIRQFWELSRTIAFALLGLFLLAGAGLVSAGGLDSRVQGKQLLQRTVLAAAAVALSLPAFGELVKISNALVRAFLSVDPGEGAVRLERLLSLGLARSAFDLLLILAALLAGLAVLFSWLVRLVLLVLAAAGGPLLLVTHTLPHSDQWAKAWWRAVLALLAAPVVQAMLYTLGFWIFFSGDSLLGPIGLSFVDSLVLVVLLYLEYKIPFYALQTCAAPARRALAATRQTMASGVDVVT